MKKTNVIRELDSKKIKYKTHEYEVDENSLDAISVSLKTGQDITKIFKTLVLLNEKKELIVACVPGSDHIDLKKLAKVSGDKKLEMLDVKKLLSTTGYMRGGCSPIGIKRKHKSFIHKSALKFETILVSAGKRGIQLEIDPRDLIKYLDMTIEDIIE